MARINKKGVSQIDWETLRKASVIRTVEEKRFDISKFTDEELSKAATILILRECWHDFEPNPYYKNYGRCVICDKKETQPSLNIYYSSHIEKGLILVKKIFRRVCNETDFEPNYSAFADHIKTECLPAGNYSETQKLNSAEIFLLYLVKPRTLTEACLLAVGFSGQDLENK